MSQLDTIILYGTAWCGGTRRCRLLLERYHIPFQYIDIEQDEEAGKLVESLNRGYRSVPTIIWPDGSKLTEPSDDALLKKLGVD